MKTRKQKHERSKEISEKLSRAKVTIFTSFAQTGSKGLNVSAMKELRKKLRPIESEYGVEKKTVLDKALQSMKRESSVFTYPGSLGVAYGFSEPYATAKALYQFAKKNTALKLFGGLMGDDILDEAMVVEMANMPTKEVLLGRLVGMLSYPVRSLAIVLSQIKHE